MRKTLVRVAIAVSIIVLFIVFTQSIYEPLNDYRHYIRNEIDYTVTRGNLLMIFMSDEYYDPPGTISNATFSWWKQEVIQNQEMNIITLTHQPLCNTVGGSETPSSCIENSERFISVLDSFRVSVWMSGHVHLPHGSGDSMVAKWGTVFIDDGSISRNWPDGKPSQARYLQFTVGSREVVVKSRDHSNRAWNTRLEHSFALTYPLQMENAHTSSFSVWVFSDIQPRNETEWNDFEEIVEDSNANTNYDIAFVLGDLVYRDVSAYFERYIACLGRSTHPRTDFYHLAGNHDSTPSWIRSRTDLPTLTQTTMKQEKPSTKLARDWA